MMPADDELSAQPINPPLDGPPQGAVPLNLGKPPGREREVSGSPTQGGIDQLVQAALGDLERRKRALELEIETLERRRDRIEAEMKGTFAGTSQDLALRVQGFKDYLVGSLQDLAMAVEQLPLTPPPPPESTRIPPSPTPEPESPALTESPFLRQRQRIETLLEGYRLRPDYYGPVWQLRRTFEPVHGDRVAYWFFEQGGRGAIKTFGSRLQNALVASAAISILRTLQGDRLRVLMLANTPERLGEWRRGFQDCLGVSRGDFGTGRGIMLFESPDPLAQRAERLLADNWLPLIIVDESEGSIRLPILQFPLWLAFAPDPANPTPDFYEYY